MSIGKVQEARALPHQLTKGVQASRDNAIRAIQANFEHLQAQYEDYVRSHNELVDLVNRIAAQVEDLTSQTV